MAAELDLSVIPDRFRALFVAEPGSAAARMATASVDDLGEGDVLIEVAYSSLNYKDGLALTGRAPVVRRFPLIGGIDLAGTVVASANAQINVGDEVVATGWGLGEDHPGGYSEYARLPASWCERLPPSISMRDAAALGTAGVTAMLSLMALGRNRSAPADLGDLSLAVTGSSGGVGSLAVLLAARLGYRVVASTGRTDESAFLISLGADEVIDRAELDTAESSTLAKVRFGAGVDGVGGRTLTNLVRAMRANGTVAAYGLAGGVELGLSVHPFILRGVTLTGINSVRPPGDDRSQVWRTLAATVRAGDLDQIVSETSLEGLVEYAPVILRGGVRGRVVVAISGCSGM